MGADRTDMTRASPLSRPVALPATVSAMASSNSHRELNHRSNDGIDVWLLWDPGTDSVSVRVADAKAGAELRDPGQGPPPRDGRLQPPVRVRRLTATLAA